MIEAVSFGSMTVNGKRFTSDLIIFPGGRVVDGWWRERGHGLSKKDIASLIESKPDVIIAGTGVNGLMKPEPGLASFLEKNGIEFMAAPNEKAAALYNDLAKNKRVGAGFHLFC
jgi:hypothetical protein